MGIYRYQRQQNGQLQDCKNRNSQGNHWDFSDRHSSHSSTSAPPSQPPSENTSTPWQQDWQQNSSQPKQRPWLKVAKVASAAVKNLSLIVTGGVALASLGAFVVVWRSGSQVWTDVQGWLSTPQPEPKVDLRPMVVQQLQNSSELTTAVFSMQTVVPASRDRTVGGYVIGTTTLLYIAYGEVRAGVDLSDLTPADVQVNGDTISVRLPPPQILDRKLDVDRSKVYDYDRGFLGLGPDVATELQELAEQTTLNEIVAAACNQGVLQMANERAQETVSSLLAPTGYTSRVEIQPPSPDACPSSPTAATVSNLPNPPLPATPPSP